MNRRNYLKSSLAMSTGLVMPPAVLALVGCSGTAPAPELAEFNGQIMGTSYSIRTGQPLTEAAKLAVRAALQDVDTHMSTWRIDSELTRFNNSTDTDWQLLTSSTIAVVAQALQTSQTSEGAFDISVGPLVDLWGFGARASNDASSVSAKPDRQAILQTLTGVGHDTIEIDVSAHALRKLNPVSRLDLSGIAKGHAVDQVASALDGHGLDDYLVEVGGELRSSGTKPDGSTWRVAIERPQVGRRDVFRVIELDNQAIATSGDYRNFFDAGGQRYSHSIDPRTGQPVDHELASVSVVANSTMTADALSTSFMIMGPDEAMAFAERHDVAAHLILKSGLKLAERTSSAFEAQFG